MLDQWFGLARDFSSSPRMTRDELYDRAKEDNMSETNSTIDKTDEFEVEKLIPVEEPEQAVIASIPVPLWTLPPEERVKVLEKFWRELRPIYSGDTPYPSRDELCDRN